MRGSHVFSCVFVGSCGFLWVLVGPYGLSWVTTCFHALSRALTGPYEFCWVLMGFDRLSWAPMWQKEEVSERSCVLLSDSTYASSPHQTAMIQKRTQMVELVGRLQRVVVLALVEAKENTVRPA